MAAIDDLGKARYVNLETFRKNGTGVQTPVWVGRDGNELVIFTNGDSYKVKRLRRNPKIRIAPCNVRGGLKGPWHEGTARLVDDVADETHRLALRLVEVESLSDDRSHLDLAGIDEGAESDVFFGHFGPIHPFRQFTRTCHATHIR